GSIAFKQNAQAFASGTAFTCCEPGGNFAVVAWEVLAAADSHPGGGLHFAGAQEFQGLAAQVFAQCAERGPLATDQRKHGGGVCQAGFLDLVVTGYEPWSGIVVAWERADAG